MNASPARSTTACPPDILRCPVSGGPLRMLGMAEIRELNQQIGAGRAWHRDGTVVRGEVTQAFRSLQGPCGYVVRDGILLMLPALAVVTSREDARAEELRDEKAAVQGFYDELGWERNAAGDFVDAEKFEDLRPVAAEYIRRCHERVGRHLAASGRFLLDVASGPVQYDEYLAYSEHYQARICVDLSFSALCSARRKLGNRGIYILGDITNLPLADGTVDGAVSLHTIYHVPADEQARAFREVHRVLAPGRAAVVVYAWRKSTWLRLAELPSRIAALPRKLLAKLGSRKPSAGHRPLYFHSHRYEWFQQQDWPFEAEIGCWRSIPVKLSHAYCHPWLGGRILLRWLYACEERWPRAMGVSGAYPLIVIRKPEPVSKPARLPAAA